MTDLSSLDHYGYSGIENNESEALFRITRNLEHDFSYLNRFGSKFVFEVSFCSPHSRMTQQIEVGKSTISVNGNCLYIKKLALEKYIKIAQVELKTKNIIHLELTSSNDTEFDPSNIGIKEDVSIIKYDHVKTSIIGFKMPRKGTLSTNYLDSDHLSHFYIEGHNYIQLNKYSKKFCCTKASSEFCTIKISFFQRSIKKFSDVTIEYRDMLVLDSFLYVREGALISQIKNSVDSSKSKITKFFLGRENSNVMYYDKIRSLKDLVFEKQTELVSSINSKKFPNERKRERGKPATQSSISSYLSELRSTYLEDEVEE